jgi:hypothetical protein
VKWASILLIVLVRFIVVVGHISWAWKLDPSGSFSSSSLRKLIESHLFQNFEVVFEWNNWVPLKVNFTCWRVALDRLLTLAALVERKITIENSLCPLCGIYYEDSRHVFFKCGLASTIWCIIMGWLKMPITSLSNMEDLWMLVNDLVCCKEKRKFILAIAYVTIWCIWNARNNKVYNNVVGIARRLVEDIKVHAYTWIKHRVKRGGIDLKVGVISIFRMFLFPRSSFLLVRVF